MEQVNLQRPSRMKHVLTAILIGLLLWGSAMNTEASLTELIEGGPEMMKLLGDMIPPDWGYFSEIVEPMLDTIRMALIGTLFGAILSIPITLFSASNVFPSKWVVYPARFILNLLRAIPELLLAALFVPIFGIGMIPGIFALTFFSVGIIAKLTYESMEAIDPGPLEAMTAVGANKPVWILFSVIPQVSAPYLSYVLYVFEINVRAAAVLGLVGAGGIGLYYEHTLGFLLYDKTSSIIIFTLVIVLIIDYISHKIREKLV